MDLNLPFLFSAFSHLSSELLNLFHRLVNFFLSLFLSHIHCFPRDAAVLSPDVLPLDSLQRVNISFSFPTWRSRRLKTILLWIRLYSCVFTDAVFRVFEQNLGVFSPFSRFREHLSKFSFSVLGIFWWFLHTLGHSLFTFYHSHISDQWVKKFYEV